MDLIPSIVEAIKKYKISSVVVEKAGGGLPLLQTMNRHIDNFAINIEGVSHRNQNKRQRLEAHLGMMSLGNVLVPQGADWLPLVRQQMRAIALERNVADDVGDAVLHGLTKASTWLAGGFATGTATWGRAAAFTPRNSGTASWTYGTAGHSDGGFETDGNKPFPGGKASWER